MAKITFLKESDCKILSLCSNQGVYGLLTIKATEESTLK
jgi:hypothetical protein